MPPPHPLLRHFRHQLANPHSLLHMSALGIISGCSSALIILAFRMLIEWPSSFWMPGGDPDNFEQLPAWLHFLLPIAGALIIGIAMSRMAIADTRVGIVHVITQLHSHSGHLPLRNALLQFFGGAFAIVTGQSGGREGPAIHLGSAANSLLGQKLMLPNNSIRLLVGCGTAAAIAAAFNTPIAGVIFAMEVVMLEYTVSGFIPVMLASITGTAITRAVYGSGSLFMIPPVEMASLWELPYIVFLGFITGCFAALFQTTLKLSLRFSDRPVLLRCMVAGLVTGTLAFFVPQVMGIGYDSLNSTLIENLPFNLLLALIIAKIFATALSMGLGLPIGLIGPNLLIGACIGSAVGTLGATLFPSLSSSHSFYVLLGMGAMMGAVLNAPLAALMAVLEFSNNTAMIFPGMLAITIATLTHTELFKQRSAHQTVLNNLKQLLPTDPFSLALQRTSVASVMQRGVCRTETTLSPVQIRHLLSEHCYWYIVRDAATGALTLIHHTHLNPQLEAALNDDDGDAVDLLLLATASEPLATLHIQATLREALIQMDNHQVNALYVAGNVTGPYRDHGVITRGDIERHYKTPILL